MIIPYSTDAPIYHLPIATVGVIALNVLLFVGLSTEQTPDWMLIYGSLQPLTWISSTFLHANVSHLLGNMIFLWAFGLVVEGKTGWWKFLVLYLVIALAAHCVEASIMYAVRGGQTWESAFIPEFPSQEETAPDDAKLPSTPSPNNFAVPILPIGSLGASGAIFGLLACCMIWAPKNSFSCMLWIGLRPTLFEIPIFYFALFYLGYEAVLALISSNGMSSEILHLLGAGAGAIAGVVMLKSEWVDCENWDAFSVWAGKNLLSRDELEAQKRASPQAMENAARKQEKLLEEIESVAAQGNPQLAWLAHQKMQGKIRDWKLPAPTFRKIISAYQANNLHVELIPLLVEYLRTHSEMAAKIRLMLAEILVTKEKRPAQALRVLEKIPAGALGPDLEVRCQKIRARADALRSHEDYFELDSEDY